MAYGYSTMRSMRRLRRGTYRRRSYSRGYRRRAGSFRSPQFRSMQAVHVDIPVTFNVAFKFDAGASFSAPIPIPLLTAFASPVDSVSVVGLSEVFNRYASLYDQVKLLTANLSSVMLNYPAGASSVRLYCMIDRMEAFTDATSIAFTVQQMMQSPGTVVRQLNSSQYDYTNMKVYAKSNSEKYSWYDSDMEANSHKGLYQSNVRYRGGFAPIYYLALQSAAAFSAPTTLSLAIRFDLRVSFRNPRAKYYAQLPELAHSSSYSLPEFVPASTLLSPVDEGGVD